LTGAEPAAAAKKEPGQKKEQYALERTPVGPAVLAIVSIDDQRITLYDAEGKLVHASVSTGQTGYETPVGIFSVLQKKAEHYSNIYENAAMPHMQRITWSGVALHGGPLPGYPASHGCVRLPFKFAEKIFDLTKLGMRVIISRTDVAPVSITHPLLFKRTPYQGESGIVTKAAALVGNMIGSSSAAEAPADPSVPADVAERAEALQAIFVAKTAEADEMEKQAEPARAQAKKLEPEMKRAKKALTAAEKAEKRALDSFEYWQGVLATAEAEKAKKRAETEHARAEAKLAEVRAKLETVRADAQPKIDAYQQAADALKVLEDARDAARTEARAAQRKLSPVSVFISRKTQKLYVRQGFEPVFESDVTIQDPFAPIGTHTFTAVAYGDNGLDMRWNVVTLTGGQGRVVENDDFYYYDDDYGYDWRRRRAARTRPTSKEAVPTDVNAASAVLDRISIPQDVVDRISELVLPGSSLIVSDEEAHKETGQQTDFIVVISGEPAGALKNRRRDPYGDDFYSYGYDDYYSRRNVRRRGGGGPFFWW
jgi:hypothetical protein